MLLAALLAATPSAQLAITPFSVLDLPEARGQLLAEHLGARLIEHGVRVTTPKDIQLVLGLERQRQLLGCSAGAECLVELAGALGVKELITGEVAKLDSGYQLVVKVIAADTGAARFARTARVDTERELFSSLDAWAMAIAGKTTPRSWAPLIPLAAGVVAAGVGTGFLISANTWLASLQRRGTEALSYSDALVAKNLGPRDQWIGVGLTSAGALAVAAGLTWFLLSSPQSGAATTWLVPTPRGLALVGCSREARAGGGRVRRALGL